VGSKPAKVACITVLTGNRLGQTVGCGRPPLLPSCRKLEFRLSALMYSDVPWANGKSAIDKADAMLTLSAFQALVNKVKVIVKRKCKDRFLCAA